MGGDLVRGLRAAIAIAAAGLAGGGSTAAGAATIPAADQGSGGIYFVTDEALLPSDTDSAQDVYRRANGVLTLESLGASSCQPACGNGPDDVEVPGASVPNLEPEGVIFSTAESLLPSDSDSSIDIYERVGATITQISVGPKGFNGPQDTELFKWSPDGSTVVFSTKEQLVGADTDSARDVYQWSGGTTTLVSQGPEEFNGEVDAVPVAASDDASVVFFTSADQLVASDTDSSVDLYRRAGGSTELFSRGSIGASPSSFNGPYDVDGFVVCSSDGSRATFSTDEPLTGNDEDTLKDVYTRSGETTILVSLGSSYNGNEGDFPSFLDGADGDLNITVFSTREKLNEVDQDKSTDIYRRLAGGVTELASQGPPGTFPGIYNGPGTQTFLRYLPGADDVFFSTEEKLVATDVDSSPDIYERTPTTTVLVSKAPTAFNGPFTQTLRQTDSDGSHIFFTTTEQMVPGDSDTAVDLYERIGDERTVLRSTGEINGNGAFDVTPFGGVKRVLLSTAERLVPGDTDAEPDLYAQEGDRTSLVSTATPDPAAPALTATSPAPPANANAPSLSGSAVAQSRVEIFTDAQCSGLPVASGDAAALASPGLTVTVPDDSTTTFYAAAIDADGNASPCSTGLVYVEDSTALAPSFAAVVPAGPANDNLPRVRGGAEEGSTVELFTDPVCAGAPAASGSAAGFSAPGIAVSVPDNTTTRFYGRVVDLAGNVSACAAGSSAYVEDSLAPDTTIGGGPKGRTHQKKSSFTLGASETATFTCRVDFKKVQPCASPFRTPGLKVGSHRITVTATDLAGNVDPTPAVRSFTLLHRQRHRP
jgi:hypothetical protein